MIDYPSAPLGLVDYPSVGPPLVQAQVGEIGPIGLKPGLWVKVEHTLQPQNHKILPNATSNAETINYKF